MSRLRAAVSLVLLGVLASAGLCCAAVMALVGLAFGSGDSGTWFEGIRSLAFTVAGSAALAALPAVLAIWLRVHHPVASGLLATLVGGTCVLAAGQSFGESSGSTIATLGGLALVVSSVPLPSPSAADLSTSTDTDEWSWGRDS
jgi:hypothetical protein